MNKKVTSLILGMILLNILLITMPMISKNMVLKQKNRELIQQTKSRTVLQKQEQSEYIILSQVQKLLESSDLHPLSERISFQDGFRYELVLSSANQEGLKGFVQALDRLSSAVVIKEAEIRFGEEETSSLIIESYGERQ